MNKEIILHLSLISGVGAPSLERVIAKLCSNEFDIYASNENDVMQQCGVSSAVAQKIVSGLADTDLLCKELERIERYNISWTTVFNEDYPALLKQIHMPPAVIYWRGGSFTDDNTSLAVVGSRAFNEYGKKVVHMIIPDIVAAGVVTVSGGALGIDTIVHEQTLKSGGKTIAVLGSGLLQLYPASNRRLFESIIASGGIVMSAFPLLEEPFHYNFPARNRIISGLSHGCLVVQAAEKSGALITARYALDQGRAVFAIPGMIDDPLTAGCHALVQNGAQLVTTPNDILNEFSLSHSRPIIQNIQTNVFDDLLSDTQKTILSICRTPSSMNDIISASGLPVHVIQNELFQLQLEGKVSQDFVGMWVKSYNNL